MRIPESVQRGIQLGITASLIAPAAFFLTVGLYLWPHRTSAGAACFIAAAVLAFAWGAGLMPCRDALPNGPRAHRMVALLTAIAVVSAAGGGYLVLL